MDASYYLVIKAHAGLRFSPVGSREDWAGAGVTLDFLEPPSLVVLPPDGTPVLVPAASEPDVALIRSLRHKDCLRQIIAVVDDLDGHQTFRAIDSGASAVLNVRLPHEKQLGAVLATCSGQPRRGPRLTEVRALEPAANTEAADPEDTGRLMRMLCGTSSISAIAREFYCSERSMYRRLRRLYEQLGVSGRSELKSRMADRSAMLVAVARH
ncbi:hypothetical protein ACQPXB_44155 [Amycolatopsis sp. CA-161197]|uniref:hypothetical protein n=1 Tax=unclassified Amycolatopsis TaxID=2618356 RepID=UPI003452F30F